MNTDQAIESANGTIKEDLNRSISLKKGLLYALVASVAVGALLGIAIVLRDQWGWFEVRVILTTITIAGASLCGLACDLSRTPRGMNLLPYAGLGLTLLAATLLIAGMWLDIEEVAYWKSACCVSIFAVATVHVCLLSIAKLTGHFRWALLVSYQVVYGLAILLAILVIGEIDDPQFFRLVAVLAILDAALSLVIPLLHRICKSNGPQPELLSPLEQRNLVAIDEEIRSLQKRLAALEKLRAELAGANPASAGK